MDKAWIRVVRFLTGSDLYTSYKGGGEDEKNFSCY